MWKAAEAFGKRKKAFLCRCVAAGEVQCPQSQSGRKSYRFSARHCKPSTPKCQKTKITSTHALPGNCSGSLPSVGDGYPHLLTLLVN